MADTIQFRTVSADDFERMLNEHLKWLESGGRDGTRGDFNRIDFTQQPLKGAIEQAVFRKATFSQANFSSANLSGLSLAGINLSKALLENVRMVKTKVEGGRFVGAVLNNAVLIGLDANSTDFTGATALGADFSGAKLVATVLSDCILTGANFFNAYMAWIVLINAKLDQANLSGVQLYWGNLTRCKLAKSNLSSAQLNWSELADADLKEADLTHADLRHTTGLRLNVTFVQTARFSPVQSRIWAAMTRQWRHINWIESQFPYVENDPWSVLRQCYSGPRVILHTLLLLCFVMPNVSRAIYWAASTQLQERLESSNGTTPVRMAATPNAEDKPPPIHPPQTRFIWEILLRRDLGIVPMILSLLLVAYLLCLAVLVTNVITLRDEEVRSGYSPAWSEYGRLILLHRFQCWVYYIVLVSFLWNLSLMLITRVRMPV